MLRMKNMRRNKEQAIERRDRDEGKEKNRARQRNLSIVGSIKGSEEKR
jgi:hypothetical protein